MSFVDITVTGLAFCRPVPAGGGFPNGQSQILLLHPPGHNPAITIQRLGSSPSESPIQPARQYTMSITTTGSTVPRAVPLAQPVTALVNLIQKHTSFSGAGSTLRFKPKSDTNMKISYLLIPTKDIFTTSQTKLFHEIWVHNKKVGSPSRLPTDGVQAKLWRNLAFRFEIPNDAASSLSLNITKPFNQTHQRSHEAGADYQITFDNDCHGTCGNDFGYYYEILEGKDSQLNLVEIEEFPIRERIPLNPGEDSEAACNPVIVDGPAAPDLGVWYT